MADRPRAQEIRRPGPSVPFLLSDDSRPLAGVLQIDTRSRETLLRLPRVLSCVAVTAYPSARRLGHC